MAHYDCSCCGESFGVSHEYCSECRAGRCGKPPSLIATQRQFETLVKNIKLITLDEDSVISGVPDEVVEAGMATMEQIDKELKNYVSGETTDWDDGMIVCAIFKSMLLKLSES